MSKSLQTPTHGAQMMSKSILFLSVGVLLSLSPSVYAALPWEAPLCEVARSLSGPVANAIGVIVVVLTGLMLSFGEVNGILKTLMGLMFGLSVAFLANSWIGFFDASRQASCFATM